MSIAYNASPKNHNRADKWAKCRKILVTKTGDPTLIPVIRMAEEEK